ncbi:heme o synthase [Aliiglaciecola sp. M165]|uniref:heme o synthase n=1 Tax=Aliiglaciecola sp. M165 TaxID=2593649 RepID=UPI00118035AE|nr:heme o synthase [Aliiglaciecola sp. M165]TRY33292.1 protoheme IX farnesyltransferase [Aliiglaciecola sp. M165]
MQTQVQNPRSLLSAYCQLGKARLCLLVLFTGMIGYAMGAQQWQILECIGFLLGTFLTAMGANGLNQWVERHRDAKMARTRLRPIPSGTIGSIHGCIVTALWSLSGIVILYFTVNLLTAYLGFVTLVCYLMLYTPLKPHTPLAVLIGAVPGALPPVMGWAAATGRIDIEAVILGFILFLWQIPHFMSLAAIYREDYLRGGYQLLPDNPEEDKATRAIIVVFSVALLVITLMAPAVGLGKHLFLFSALILGGALLWLSIRFYRRYSISNARSVFRASIIYIPILMTLLLIDHRI